MTPTRSNMCWTRTLSAGTWTPANGPLWPIRFPACPNRDAPQIHKMTSPRPPRWRPLFVSGLVEGRSPTSGGCWRRKARQSRHYAQAVESGRVKISDASKAVDQSAEVQEKALDRVLRGASKTISSAVRQIQSEAVEAADAQALESNLAQPVDETITLHRSGVADLSGLVAPASVDAIITNPPYGSEFLPVFSDLAAFAAHALKQDGVMVVMNSGMHLPQVLECLNHADLKWISEFDLQHQGVSVGAGPPHWVTLRRRPLLVYGKPGFSLNGGDNVIAVPLSGELPPEQLTRNLLDEAMALIVERFARPGQVVCDPIPLDRASTALAARKRGCFFIGADTNDVNLGRIRRSLTRDDGDGGSESNSQVVSPDGPIPAAFPTEDGLDDAQTNPAS